MDTFEFNYKTTLPKEANAPSVTIKGYGNNEYDVLFYIVKLNGLQHIKSFKCKTNQILYSGLNQWCSNWYIEVRLNGELVASDTFNPNGKVVFIKIDGYALGDNIAWIPYVEEFRKKHNCTVICSSFHNNLFKDIYKDILFVAPNTNIDNVYAQYYIGASYDDNPKYSPVFVNEMPLQYVASSILYLPNVEVRSPLEKQLEDVKYNQKYVCISEFASSDKKHWKCEGGWQQIVDYLNSINYDVLVISKEPTELKNVINLTGDHSILSRANVLRNAEFFIGLSSGLSWLSWAVNTHVFMISDVTHSDHEFKSNMTRINANPQLTSVDYNAPFITKPETVIDSIKKYLESIN
jgi:autotransporter strand-loop-strand O-heptosyltransferase